MEKDSLNDGHVKEVTPDMFEKAANDFSEGNEALKKLLEYCFENGIKTQACCSGHEGKKMPYIQFELDENNMGAILKMLKHLSLGDIITNFSFVKQPGVTSHFHVSIDNDKYNEGFEQILGALQHEKEVELTDLEQTTQLMLKSMQKHCVLNSLMEIEENKDDIRIVVGAEYSSVLSYDEEKVKLLVDGRHMLEDSKDSREVIKTLVKLESATKNEELLKTHPYNQEKIEDFWNNKDNIKAIQINELATRERRGAYNESNVVVVDITLGSKLEDVVGKIMQLQQAGQACVTKFNAFAIDSRDYTSAEEIIEAYNKDREMHQVRKNEKTEDISLDEIREATDGLTSTRVFGVTKDVKGDVQTEKAPIITVEQDQKE